MTVKAFFLQTRGGQRFCIYHAAAGSNNRGAIVYLHPFAEEMNKSRRMAAMQSRALAASGYDVLQIDLLGCGDSSGDFTDATWSEWIDDALHAVDWLRQRNDSLLWIWGLRTGGLLATAVAARIPDRIGLLLWNPTIVGKQYLRQFLRLKVAGDLLAGEDRGVSDQIRNELAAGRTVEIAGYCLSAKLAQGIEKAAIDAALPLRSLCWIETSPRDEPSLPPLAETIVEKWRSCCPDIGVRAVSGPAFWQTTEIEDAPNLIAATLEELSKFS